MSEAIYLYKKAEFQQLIFLLTDEICSVDRNDGSVQIIRSGAG